MFVHCFPNKMFVVLLVGAAVVVGSRPGRAVGAGASGQAVAAAGDSRGNPHAVPPILAPATRAELALIRQVEAREAAASAYHPSASALYSLAGLNGYASSGR